MPFYLLSGIHRGVHCVVLASVTGLEGEEWLGGDLGA